MSEAHVNSDMRKHSRRTVELPVLITEAANRVRAGLNADAADISAGGAFLRSDLLFELGEVLTLAIELGLGQTITTKGRVVRIARGADSEHAAGMGIEFVGLSTADRAAIEAAIK